MRQAHVSYLNALWYFSFLLCLSSNTHLKQPERMGREQKVLWFFFFPHTYAFHIHFYQWEIKTRCQ